jgi:hypothetical protein
VFRTRERCWPWVNRGGMELVLVSNGFGDCQGSQLVARRGMDSLGLCREGYGTDLSSRLRVRS